MTATFTPPGGLTLSAYAAQFQCGEGVACNQFDWQQQITNWPNPDLFTHADGTIVPVPTNPPFFDPPSTGYSYNPCGAKLKAPGSAGMAFPEGMTYYPAVSTTQDCWVLSNNETPSTLKFADEPMDPQLTPTQKSTGDIAKFTTTLVGINTSDGTVVSGPALFSWTWESNFNGSVGGAALLATTANSPKLDPGADGPTSCDPGGQFPPPDPSFCGTGRVTILTINGVPCKQPPGEPQPGCEPGGGIAAAVRGDPPAVVPEPPGSLLLASGMLAILAARRMARPILCVADMAIR
jgi:hypothetical protein